MVLLRSPGTMATPRGDLPERYAMNQGSTNGGHRDRGPEKRCIGEETISPGLYVHIPFCTVRCSYCDFHVASFRTQIASRYVDSLLTEADLLAAEGTFQPKTIFVGGGTPSVLSTPDWARLLQGLADRFGHSLLEWTVEANPGTIDLEKGELARSAGVNRISTGAQTFDPHGLAVLGREHGPDVVERAHEVLREAGFERLSLDLIIGWPGQTTPSLESDLQKLASIDPDHVSLYHLSYESGTMLERKRQRGAVTPLSDEDVIQLSRTALGGLERAGYTRYEVSNLSRPGEESLHNLNYWQRGLYRGLGSGAASFDGVCRFKNRPDVGAYIRSEGRPELVEVEEITPQTALEEIVFLSLRLSDGLSLKEFEARSGDSLLANCPESLEELIERGLLELTETHLRATERGFEVLDALILKIWEECQRTAKV